MLRERNKKLLEYIIEDYIKTAEPVASHALVEKYNLDLSSATIRNEMVNLEKSGYIYQPHISAGRIPTEKAYRFYIKNFLKEKKLTRQRVGNLDKVKKVFNGDHEQLLREIAKRVAEFSKETVIVAFNPKDIYYTGVSNLFNQPEFREEELLNETLIMMDQLDSKIQGLFNKAEDDIEILVGKENPLSNKCSVISTRFNVFPKQKSVFSILGPMRMDYEENLALIKFIHQLIN